MANYNKNQAYYRSSSRTNNTPMIIPNSYLQPITVDQFNAYFGAQAGYGTLPLQSVVIEQNNNWITPEQSPLSQQVNYAVAKPQSFMQNVMAFDQIKQLSRKGVFPSLGKVDEKSVRTAADIEKEQINQAKQGSPKWNPPTKDDFHFLKTPPKEPKSEVNIVIDSMMKMPREEFDFLSAPYTVHCMNDKFRHDWFHYNPGPNEAKYRGQEDKTEMSEYNLANCEGGCDFKYPENNESLSTTPTKVNNSKV